MEALTFNFGESEVRLFINENNEPEFCANDVTRILGYANGRQAIEKNCKQKGVSKRDTLTKGGLQSLTYIDEGNLYRLVLKSEKPEAEKFENWVCDEVLPSIRKHGLYATPATIDELVANPDLLIKLATELKEERAQKEILANKLELQAPKVEVYEQIANSDSLLSFNDAAKALGVGRNKMMNDLRTRKILRANNTPYQDYINSGYFEVKVKNIRFGTGDKNYTQTFVTGKGLTWLGKILKSNK